MALDPPEHITVTDSKTEFLAHMTTEPVPGEDATVPWALYGECWTRRGSRRCTCGEFSIDWGLEEAPGQGDRHG